MRKSWDQIENINGMSYRTRLFEDLRGSDPPVFVIERTDSQMMSGQEARAVHQHLNVIASFQEEGQPFQEGKSRIWEQSPNGELYELSYSDRQTDVNRDQHDLGVAEYSSDVRAGVTSPQVSSTVDLHKKEITPSLAEKATGQSVMSYEQEHQQSWEQLNYRWEP